MISGSPGASKVVTLLHSAATTKSKKSVLGASQFKCSLCYSHDDDDDDDDEEEEEKEDDDDEEEKEEEDEKDVEE